MRRFRLRSQQGYIMILALLVGLLALSLGSSALTMATTGARLAHQSAESIQAYYVTQAGIEDMANHVVTNFTYPVGTSNWGPFNLGAGSYRLQVTYDGMNGYSIVSTGTVGSTSRTIQASGIGFGFNSVIFVFGSTTTANWSNVNLKGTVANGVTYPAQVYHNGSLTIQKGNLGSAAGGGKPQINANLNAVNTLTLAGQKLSKAPNCSVSGSPWTKGGVTLYGTGTGCWTGGAYKSTDYASLMAVAKANNTYFPSQFCPLQGVFPLVLSQWMFPNPLNNYVLFIDCSGYTGSGRNVEIGTDATGLNGSFTLVIYGKGNKNLLGLVIDNFNAQPGSDLGIISDIPNQTISGSTVSAFMRFDATTGHASFVNNSTVNGAITAYDIDTGSGVQTFNVQPIVSGVPPGFSNFTFNTWSN